MKYIKIAGEVCLELFCSWTLAYHLCLALRLPSLSVLPIFLIVFSTMLYFSSKGWKAAGEDIRDNAVVLALIAMALLLGLFAACANRPDSDDFMLFHRALVQLNELGQPFHTDEPSFNVPGVPVITILHLLTSYEVLAAFSARLFHLDPIWLYQVGMAFTGSAMFPFVYFLLYREFGAGKWASVGGSAFAALFLFIDGNVHRSLGNFAFVRMWQGKAIVFTLLLPATILLCRSYLNHPGRRAFLRLAMVGVCAVGLSDAGVFLIPVMVLALTVSNVLIERSSLASLRQMVLLWTSMFYPLVVGAALMIGVFPKPSITRVFWIGYPDQWWRNLSMVIDSRGVLIRDVLIVILAPLVALKARDAAFFIVLAIVCCLIFANPVTGPLWLDHIFPASYWRLTYLFPLPFLFGLAISSQTRGDTLSWISALRALAVLTISFSTIHAMSSTTVAWVSLRRLSFTRFLRFKTPWDYNLPGNELAFARSVSGQLQNRTVLAPEQLNWVLGLIDPGIKFEDSRWDYTMLAFDNLGIPDDGQRRIAAGTLVATCRRSSIADAALMKAVQDGVDAIVVSDCAPDDGRVLDGLIDTLPGSWRLSARSNGYILFLRGT